MNRTAPSVPRHGSALPLLAALAWAWFAPAAWAFTDPVDEFAGARVEILGVTNNEEKNVAAVLEFKVKVLQKEDRPLTGALKVYLNDDWDLLDPGTLEVNLPGAGQQEFAFRARAKPSVLDALYPVHALANLKSGEREIELHPIAIFMAKHQAAGETPAKAAANLTALRAAGPVAIDGDLGEWTKAVAVASRECGLGTGEIRPDSFDAVFYALHDDQNLYFAAKVSDDDISCADQSSEDYMNSDYLRLYLSPQDPATREDVLLGASDTVLAINVLGGGDKPLVKSVTYGLPLRADFDLARCQFAAKRTEVGYNLEIAIPKALLGGNLAAGAVLGANVMFGDADAGSRRGEVVLGRTSGQYWTNPRSYARLFLAPETALAAGEQAPLPMITVAGGGIWPLARLQSGLVGFAQNEATTTLPLGWSGSDPKSGASYGPTQTNRGGESLPAIGIHPPYRQGTGGVWGVYRLKLDTDRAVKLSFKTAIRDNRAEEPASDGVEFKVFAQPAGGAEKELFTRFSAAKTWEPAEVDLAEYRGQEIFLKLWAGPGPQNNTTCDAGFWGEPMIVAGEPRSAPTEAVWQERINQAMALAQAAEAGNPGQGAWKLDGLNGAYGAAVVPGPAGLADAVLVFSQNGKSIAFKGFTVEIGGEALGDWRSGSELTKVTPTWADGRLRLTHELKTARGLLTAQIELAAVTGGLTLEFAMPGVERDPRGEPRYTRLVLGPATAKLKRVYAGFGNVIENPPHFTIGAGGFQLSTRHVGADYESGLSLLQASDIYPDRLECRPEDNSLALVAHHDTKFWLVPAASAFAAARQYRDLRAFKAAPGVAQLKGRMCLDQWGGDYGEAAEGVLKAGAYGLNHSIFVKHSWQRWGYDYRLPEIYPPQAQGRRPDGQESEAALTAFRQMPEACRQTGILFCPHDNYIDFYPDAEGFSYDHIIFNQDGTPQLAWYNKGRQAQSYRWLPHAFFPWLEKNMNLMRDGFGPDALFIDVFTAMPPVDYYDRAGKFYPKTRTAQEWGRAFNRCREMLGHDAPMVSEAGADALIGDIDAGQSDHMDADLWGIENAVADRTPWHDMASHGSYILLAGGLGPRYSGWKKYPGRNRLHGYGSDDYLSNTVIGGRNPMCDGPFSRRTVMTYWLLHDVCDELARTDLESHEFGASVHQQHTKFAGGGEVWTNRAEPEWTVDGVTLPAYGLLAKTPGGEARIFKAAGGLRAAMARSAGRFFADARPRFSDKTNAVNIKPTLKDFAAAGDNRVRFAIEWEINEPVDTGLRTFMHICNDKVEGGEKILFQPALALPAEALAKPGKFVSQVEFDLPAGTGERKYEIWYGIWNPHNGSRSNLVAEMNEGRVNGGVIVVKADDPTPVYVAPGQTESEELNLAGTLIDFGPLSTNGACRLEYDQADAWKLLALPGSLAFAVELKLAQLRPAGGEPKAVELLDWQQKGLGALPFKLENGVLKLEMPADAYGCRITF